MEALKSGLALALCLSCLSAKAAIQDAARIASARIASHIRVLDADQPVAEYLKYRSFLFHSAQLSERGQNSSRLLSSSLSSGESLVLTNLIARPSSIEASVRNESKAQLQASCRKFLNNEMDILSLGAAMNRLEEDEKVRMAAAYRKAFSSFNQSARAEIEMVGSSFSAGTKITTTDFEGMFSEYPLAFEEKMRSQCESLVAGSATRSPVAPTAASTSSVVRPTEPKEPRRQIPENIQVIR